MSAEKISIDQAKPDKLFYVVANAVVYRPEDGRCLILKRDEREKVHPGKWATIGGKLEQGDLDINKPSKVEGDVLVFSNPLFKLLGREAMEEAGVTIVPPLVFINESLIVRPDGIPVQLITFGARYGGGEVRPEKGAFTNSAWVNEVEVDSYPTIGSVSEEVKTTIAHFKTEVSLQVSY
ncbi:hypothetical protein HY857_00440 [Candidatus Saccharibacteria bacterium]|nr:hypothetical protein [Candidatus Saccharibacteria bacterium]